MTNGPNSCVLAHLSDPHLAPLPRPRVHQLLGKRITGYLNWRRNRYRVHRREVLDALVADARAQNPDHIAVTGDLLNIGLPQEIAPARHWLEQLGTSTNVTVIPGNHDAYVRGSLERFNHAFAPWMSDDVGATPGYPFVRRRGPLWLIGLSSAVPTPPLQATGLIGTAQLAALERRLAALDADGFRVLLVHHPLLLTRHNARLIDAPALLAVLKRQRVDLVLHGHDHSHTLVWIDGPAGRVPVLGVASASVIAGGHLTAAGYNLISLHGEAGNRSAEIVTRGITASGEFFEVTRTRLERPT